MSGPKVLLVHPPVASIMQGYLSTPLLLGWLRAQGVDAEQWDLNVAVARALLSRPFLERGRARLREQLAALEARPALRASEAGAYAFYQEVEPWAEHLVDAIDEVVARATARVPDPAARLALEKAFALVSCAHHPETAERLDYGDPAAPTYRSRYAAFCSADLLAAARDERSVLDDAYRALLPGRLAQDTPAVVGISVTFTDQLLPACKLACAIKRLRPECFVVLGGATVDSHLRGISQPELFGIFDMLILGEGEVPLLRLVETLASPAPDLCTVPNALYLEAGAIARSPRSSCKLQGPQTAPDYDGLILDDYFLHRDQVWLPYRLSQGCYWERCTFCEYSDDPEHRYLENSLEAIVRDLAMIVARHGIRRVHFVDAALAPKLLEVLCLRLIQAGLALEWHGNVRLERALTAPLCRLMRRAGCVQIEAGVETGNDRLLKLIKKGATLRQIELCLDNLARAGIRVHTYIIIGLPTETAEEADSTFAWVREHRADGRVVSVAWHQFFVTPGSHIANHPQAYGITAVRIPARLDLQVESWDFDAPGMTRAEARERVHRFMRGGAVEGEPAARDVAPDEDAVLAQQLYLPPEIALGRSAFDLEQVAGLCGQAGSFEGEEDYDAWTAALDARLSPLPAATGFRLTNLESGASQRVSAFAWNALGRMQGARTLREVALDLALETGQSPRAVEASLVGLATALGDGLGALLIGTRP